jgi:hypothetical protein
MSRIGVWIDHEKAVIVELAEGRPQIKTVEAGVGRHTRLSGGSRSRTPYGPQDVASESRRDAKYHKHLTEFYRSLITMFHNTEALLILGPGEAKGELNREIERVKPLRGKVVAVETTDKMTDNEIVARVTAFFAGR